MTEPYQSSRLSRRSKLGIALLIGLGLGIAAIILLLPQRPQSIATIGFSFLTWLFGSLLAAINAITYYRAGRRVVATLLAITAILLLLGSFATVSDLPKYIGASA
jgi:hypothetical protein